MRTPRPQARLVASPCPLCCWPHSACLINHLSLRLRLRHRSQRFAKTTILTSFATLLVITCVASFSACALLQLLRLYKFFACSFVRLGLGSTAKSRYAGSHRNELEYTVALTPYQYQPARLTCRISEDRYYAAQRRGLTARRVLQETEELVREVRQPDRPHRHYILVRGGNGCPRQGHTDRWNVLEKHICNPDYDNTCIWEGFATLSEAKVYWQAIFDTEVNTPVPELPANCLN